MTQLTPDFLDLQAALAGEYSIERELGRGGMGVVYLARDVLLDRHVAIKVLPGHLAERPESRERFLREARTAAGLSHPHIVPIHRVGEAAGFVFFVMSYVAGETLGERLRRAGPLSAAEAMRVMREVAWALAHAHGRGIVHRDVKPDNILLEEGTGRALVTDFGIAWRGDAVHSTDPGRIMGTAHFMSPEQGGSAPIDGRSDLYSLGVVGFLAASGRLPFDAPTLPVLLLRQSTEEAPSLATLAPGLPAALTRAVERCLRIDPQARFADGAELAAALAPPEEGRSALPAPLRAWLSERNPAVIAYAAWSGLVAIPAFFDATSFLMHHRLIYLLDMAKLAVVAAAPLVPLTAFHARRAQRLFRAGFSLADLRAALDVGDRERESELLAGSEWREKDHRVVRVATWATATVAMVVTFFSDAIRLPLELRHIVIDYRVWQGVSLGAWLATLGLLMGATMSQTRVLPRWISRAARGGLRERLWRSRLGEWMAKRLGAPAGVRPVALGVFQPTEVALGGAAAELFAKLPPSYRERLAELPDVVVALEQRAAEARAALERLDAGAEGHGAAASRLATTVAALEGIRLDLLRLHAGASDLAPLTTLIDAARVIGDDMHRIAEAQREASELLRRPRPERRIATPV